jgi:phosphate transport system substrate-binding protein
LVKIFLGEITNWQDDEIINSNPKIANLLPNDTITVIIRSEGSGTTSIFSSALNSMAKSEGLNWPYSSFQTWPTDFNSLPNFQKAKGNSGVTSYVINTVNSIGYIAFSALSKGENYQGVGMAWVPNKVIPIVTYKLII